MKNGGGAFERPGREQSHYKLTLGQRSPYHQTIMSSIVQAVQSFTGTSPKARVLAQSDNDVVIVSAVRSAITKVCMMRHETFAMLHHD